MAEKVYQVKLSEKYLRFQKRASWNEIANQFAKEERTVRAAAFAAAKRTSSQVFASQTKRESYPPKRPGRHTTSGGLPAWLASQGFVSSAGRVGFNVYGIRQEIPGIPYWQAQEIGTGNIVTAKRFQLTRAGGEGTRARVSFNFGTGQIERDHRKIVENWHWTTQIGRRIPRGLVWASGPGEGFTPASNRMSKQNLWSLQQAMGRRLGKKEDFGAGGYMINREIVAKNYIRYGVDAGWRQYKPLGNAVRTRAGTLGIKVRVI